jgi:hypothetical protein
MPPRRSADDRQSYVMRWFVAIGCVAAVMLIFVIVLLSPVAPPTSGASPATTSSGSLIASSQTAPIAGSPSPTIPDPTPGGTPFFARSWSLETIASPPGHAEFEVVDVSARGDLVLFHDAGVYDPLYLWHIDQGIVSTVADDAYEVGAPIFGRLSPDDSFLVFDDRGHLFRLDIELGQVTTLPDIGRGVRWYVFTSDSSLAVLSDLRSDVIFPPTQLWTLGLEDKSAVAFGARRDSDLIFSTDRGVVVRVDSSSAHDGSHLSLYLVASSGSDSLLFDAGNVSSLVIAPDGTHVAFSSTSPDQRGSWLVTLETGDRSRLSADGREVGFSPDSRHVSVRYADGHIASYALDGQLEGSQPNGDRAAWVGHL